MTDTRRSTPPSPPSRPAATCVYITRGRDKQLITTWGSLREARSQIALALGGEPFKWLDHVTILSRLGVKVECTHLEDIMELDDEQLLQPQEERTVERFLSDAPSTPAPQTRREKRKARVAAMKVSATSAAAPTATPGKSSSSQPTWESPPRQSSAPVQMPVDAVAEQLGVSGRQIRRAMRALRWAKPVGRWVINEEDIPALRKAIKGAAK
jgi:hypothetical protein